jgi:hypothetical protein
MKFFLLVLTTLFSHFVYSEIASDSLKHIEKHDSVKTVLANTRIRVGRNVEPNAKHKPFSVAVDWQKNEEETPKSISVSFSGYVRFLADYRSMKERYSYTEPRTLGLNGWGQPISATSTANQSFTNPLMYLEANIKPTSKSSISVGYSFNHNFSGITDSITRQLNIWRILMATAQIETGFGKFKIGTAGASGFPTVLSPLTSGYNSFHYNSFYRLPWDWFKSNNDKLDYFYNNQSVALDPRYALTSNAGIQGFVLECSKLPLGFGANIIIGKNIQTGGYLQSNDPPAQTVHQTMSVVASRQMFGARIYKTIRKHVVGINGLTNSGYINNYSATSKSSQYFLTANATLDYRKMFLDFEGGVTEFNTPAPFGVWGKPATFGRSYHSGVNQILSFKIGFKKGSVKYPSFFQLYSIGKDVVNLNSPIINTTGTNVTGYMPTYPYEVNIYKSGMLESDQVANNRNGFLFDITKELTSNFKINLAGNYSREISNVWNVITMQHMVNKYQRSQFGFFQTQLGPYGRITNQYIRSYETFKITDTIGNRNKNFYVLDFTVKRRTKFLGKPLVLGSYTSFNSVSDFASPVSIFTNAAYLRQTYEEINLNYLISSSFNITSQVGYEKVVGNKKLEMTSDNKTVNQNGYSVGAGFDWVYSKNAGLYFRQVWFSHNDVNFTKDKFSGWNTLAEIKVFF